MAAFCLGSLIFFVYGANAHQSTSCASSAVDSGLEGEGKLPPVMRSFAHGNKNLPNQLCAVILDFCVTFSLPKTIKVGWHLLSTALCSCPRYNKACCRWAHSSSSVSVQLSLLQSLLHNLIYHLPFSQQWGNSIFLPAEKEVRWGDLRSLCKLLSIAVKVSVIIYKRLPLF